MKRILVEGGTRLEGVVEVSGAKNAALKLAAAALLARGKTVLHNVPRIRDVKTMLAVLEGLGVETSFHGHTLEIDANKAENRVEEAERELSGLGDEEDMEERRREAERRQRIGENLVRVARRYGEG